MDIHAFNRAAWNHRVATGNKWTVPVGPDAIAKAESGRVEFLLTPTRFVPPGWLPPLAGCRALCLASGGGQQGPLFAAAGASVTVFDLSPQQLEQDRATAQRFGLKLETIEGDMADLSCFADDTFDLIVHPCSNCFVPEVNPVWREAARVLRRGGILLAGFMNPVLALFDEFDGGDGPLEVRYAIPYSDLTSLSAEKRQRYIDANEPLVFGHTLDDLIGGQLAAGLVLTGFFEDRDPQTPLARYIATFIATRAMKPSTDTPCSS